MIRLYLRVTTFSAKSPEAVARRECIKSASSLAQSTESMTGGASSPSFTTSIMNLLSGETREDRYIRNNIKNYKWRLQQELNVVNATGLKYAELLQTNKNELQIQRRMHQSWGMQPIIPLLCMQGWYRVSRLELLRKMIEMSTQALSAKLYKTSG